MLKRRAKTVRTIINHKKQDYQILKETKNLHNKKSHFSKTQIKEFSILYIMFNYLDIALHKVEDLSEIKFLSEEKPKTICFFLFSFLSCKKTDLIASIL